jgi:hypothetical protein
MEKVVKTTWFPFGRFDAMALWPFIFLKGDVKESTMNHERIHHRQQIELPVIFFLIYGLLWLTFFLLSFDFNTAYIHNQMEREAYANEGNPDYLKERTLFNWIKYF